MTYTNADLFNSLFSDGDKVLIRVIADDSSKATARTNSFPTIPLCTEYPGSFPCVGINPRHGKKCSTIKNLVIDIDDGKLPEWAEDHADIICQRNETHYHLYFCFADTDRDTFKKYTGKLIEMSGADKAVSDPERVIRLPYFTHIKKGIVSDGYKIIFIRETIKRLAIEKKFAWLGEIKDTTPKLPVKTNAAEYVKSIYTRKPVLCAGDGRSRELFFIGLDCHLWGVELETAITIAGEISQYRYSPPESDAIVKKQVESAYKYATSEFGAALHGETPAAQQKEKRLYEQTQKVRDKLKTWVYIHDACRFVDTASSKVLTSREQIEDYISQTVGEIVSLRVLLSRGALETCDKIEYIPTQKERVFQKDDIKYYNSFRANTEEMPRDPALKNTAAKTFIEHVNFIGTSPEERRTLLQYFAFCVQHVGKKVDWTPLIISPREGLGKSAFSVLFRKMFGEHNCSTVSAHKLLSGWTDFVAEKLFVTSHEVETSETSALTELKSLITETRVSVNAKYARTYETNNCANFLLLSNKTTALRIDGQSRRFFVILNRSDPREKEYYKTLFDAIENGAGWIYDELMATDLSDFEAHGNAPVTEGLKTMAEESKSSAVAWLDEQIEQKEGAFSTRIVDIPSIEKEAQRITTFNVTKYLTRRVITDYLHKVGFVPREYWIHGIHKRGWFKGTDDEFAKELDILRGAKDPVDDYIPF